MGIRIVTSQAVQVIDNYIWGFGQGITTYGNLTLTTFASNELKNFKYGFYFGPSTALSNQGSPNYDTHNEWNTLASINGAENLASVAPNNILTSTDWYYNLNFPQLQWWPNDVGNYTPLRIKAIANTAQNFCSGGSGSGGTPGGSGTSSGGGAMQTDPLSVLMDGIEDPELRDFLFEDIMLGREYEELQNEYRTFDAAYLYELLLNDQSMIWLGGEMDANYQDFFDQIQASKIGIFADIYKEISLGNYSLALNQLNSLSSSEPIYINLKNALQIYLNTWCNERYEFTDAEYAELWSIANQTPYVGGDGIYTARIMIGFEPDENDVAFRLQRPTEDFTTHLKLYPNPASTEVIVEFDNPEFNVVNMELKIYDLQGKLVQQTKFSTSNSIKQLSVEGLKMVYICISLLVTTEFNNQANWLSSKIKLIQAGAS